MTEEVASHWQGHRERLRTKLHPAGDLIETVRGVGYRFKGGKDS